MCDVGDEPITTALLRGTLEYCAPEILGVIPEGCSPTPPAADLYAFACTAYEILTGDLLFDTDDEMELDVVPPEVPLPDEVPDADGVLEGVPSWIGADQGLTLVADGYAFETMSVFLRRRGQPSDAPSAAPR